MVGFELIRSPNQPIPSSDFTSHPAGTSVVKPDRELNTKALNNITAFSESHKVSPVVVSFKPATAIMSPAYAILISSLEFECICNILPNLSPVSYTHLTLTTNREV